MLSHGPEGGVSHNTMSTPDMNGWPKVCTTPLQTETLRKGYPGVEQINQGGIYSYLYGAGGEAGSSTWLGWQLGDSTAAAQIADSIWWNHPYTSDMSRFDSNQWIDRPIRNDERVNYTLFQYRDIEAAHAIPGGSRDNGMVCSTFLAYAHAYAGKGQVEPHTYEHALIADASNQLYNTVKDACHSHVGFWGGLLLGVACPFYDVCGRAGSQVTNCMAEGRCDSTDAKIWKRVRDNPDTTATSISPDRIGGWGAHSGTPTTVWSSDYTHELQWNSGGNVYGCWQ
jgi:hypothetical protein